MRFVYCLRNIFLIQSNEENKSFSNLREQITISIDNLFENRNLYSDERRRRNEK